MSSDDDFDDNSPPDTFLALLHTPIKDLNASTLSNSPYKTPKHDSIDTSSSTNNSVSPQKRASSSTSSFSQEKKLKLTPPKSSPNHDATTDAGDVSKSKEPSPASKVTMNDWIVRPGKRTPSPSVPKPPEPSKRTIDSYFTNNNTKPSNDMPALDSESDSDEEKILKSKTPKKSAQHSSPVKQDPSKTPMNTNNTVSLLDSDSDDDMIKFLQSNKLGPTAKQTSALNTSSKKGSPVHKKSTHSNDDEFETVDLNAYSKVKPKSKEKIQQEQDKYKEEQEKHEHDLYIQDTQGTQFYEQTGNVVKPSKDSKYTFTLETATPSKASRSGTITSFFPSKIVSVDSEDDEPSKSNVDTPTTSGARGLGFRLPSTFVNCSLDQEFKQLQEALDEEQKNYKNGKTDDGGGVCMAVLYRYDSTNFRRSKAEKKGEEEFSRLTDNMFGYVLLPSHSKKPFFVPIKFSSKTAKADPDESQGVAVDLKWKLLTELIENKDIPKICYDAQESLKVLFMKQPQLKPQHLYDPRVAAWIYEPELASYDFNELLCYYMKITEKNSAVETNTHKCFPDMLNCFRLWTCLRSMLIKENLMEPFAQQEMKIVPILTKMEIYGIGFDAAYLNNKKKKLQQRIEELKREADKVMGHPIQLSSPQKISYALFNELGLGVYVSAKNTKQKTHQSTSEKVLKSLKAKHPLPGIILEYRHCQKLLSTWFDALEKKAVSTNQELPRIHTRWEHTNTATGRLASVNPNLQNLPKGALSFKMDEEADTSDEPFSINIRDAFCSQEGFSLVSFDYSQIEMRVLAHMSQDTFLLDFFRKGQDVHRLIASRWLNKPPEKVDDKERENAKRVVYGILYGMGPHSLSEIIGVSLSEASKFIQTFLGKFPSVNNFLDETIAFAKKNKYIKTLVNRRRLLPDINSFDQSAVRRSERQAVNSVIQGTAADIVKLAMVQVNDLVETGVLDSKRCKLLLQIHDELFFEINNDNLYEAIGVISDTMEKVIKLDVELPVRVNQGTRWGSMKPLDEKLYKTNTAPSTKNNNDLNNNATKEQAKPAVPQEKHSISNNATPKSHNDLDEEYDINYLISSRDDKKPTPDDDDDDDDDEDVACLLGLANHEDTD